MHEPGDVPRGGDRDEGTVPGADCRHERCEQRGHQQGEADRPELCQRLEVEVVHVEQL